MYIKHGMFTYIPLITSVMLKIHDKRRAICDPDHLSHTPSYKVKISKIQDHETREKFKSRYISTY